MAKVKMRKGFTLIEILVVSGIMVMFSLTIVSLFLSTIRGNTKTQVIQKVRQDGDFALKTMTRLIKQAESVAVDSDCTGIAGDSIVVNDIYDGVATFSLIDYDPGVGEDLIPRIASTSGGTDFFLSGIKVNTSSLNFTCYQRGSGNQIVTISFTLTIGAGAGMQAQEKEEQDFKTSVSLRKY